MTLIRNLINPSLNHNLDSSVGNRWPWLLAYGL